MNGKPRLTKAQRKARAELGIPEKYEPPTRHDLRRSLLFFAIGRWLSPLAIEEGRLLRDSVLRAMADARRTRRHAGLSPLNLIFWLYDNGGVDINRLVDRYGFPAILTVVALAHIDDVDDQEFFCFIQALTIEMGGELNKYKELARGRERSLSALAGARAKAAQQKKGSAKGRRDAARRIAIDFWKRSPAAKVGNVVQYLRTFDDFNRYWKRGSSYETAIKGCKQIAMYELQADRSDDYRIR